MYESKTLETNYATKYFEYWKNLHVNTKDDVNFRLQTIFFLQNILKWSFLFKSDKDQARLRQYQ